MVTGAGAAGSVAAVGCVVALGCVAALGAAGFLAFGAGFVGSTQSDNVAGSTPASRCCFANASRARTYSASMSMLASFANALRNLLRVAGVLS